jgi:hypothetical protein
MQKMNISTDFITYFNCGSAKLKSEAEILGSVITAIIKDKKNGYQ